jgi:putative ABC transport system permease protein
MDMLRSYITISLRNLQSQKVSSFINIFGLAIGMACCMLIGLYIREESRYDQHWQDSELLYRVANEVFAGDSHVKSATLAAPIAPF